MTADFSFTSIGSTTLAVSARVWRGMVVAASIAVKAVTFVATAVRAYLNRGPVLRMLEMDDHMLRDIGITRCDITSALASPFDHDPSARLRVLAVERRAGRRAQAREHLDEARRMASPPVRLIRPDASDEMR